MENVKRYTIDFSDGETAEGVLYTDYAALKARVAELDHDRIIREAYEAEFGKLDELRERIAKTTDAQHLAQLVTNKARDYAKDERDTLRAQLEAAKAQLTAQPDGGRAALEHDRDRLLVALVRATEQGVQRFGMEKAPTLFHSFISAWENAFPLLVEFGVATECESDAEILVDEAKVQAIEDRIDNYGTQALAAPASTKED